MDLTLYVTMLAYCDFADRHPKKFNCLFTRTEKNCKSFLPYCINHYDSTEQLCTIYPAYRLQHELNHY